MEISKQKRKLFKISAVVLVLWVIRTLISPLQAYAQNDFTCKVNIGGNCSTFSNACLTGFAPVFNDLLHPTCESFTTQADCNSHIGPNPCRCLLNKFCDAGTLKTCSVDGLSVVSTQDCTVTGGSCVDLPPPAHCQAANPPPGATPPSGTGSTMIDLNQLINSIGPGFKFSSSTKLGDIISRLLFYLYAIAGFGLLIFLIAGGFQYLTSAGDPKKVEAAKGIVTTALIGFIIVFVAYWLTQIANYILGLKSSF